MIRTLTLGLLAAGAMSSAMAADLIVDAPVTEATLAAAHDWSGPYVGLHAGYGWGNADQIYGDIGLPPDTEDESFSIDGWLLGAHAGINFQSGSFAGGVEALIDYAPISGNDTGSDDDTNGLDVQWLGTLAGRAGFATDSVFFYLSGGAAVMSGTGTVLDPGEGEDVGYTFFGGTVGAGVEVAASEDVSLRLDYRYYAFAEQSGSFTGNNYDNYYTPTLHTITAGVSFAF